MRLYEVRALTSYSLIQACMRLFEVRGLHEVRGLYEAV